MRTPLTRRTFVSAAALGPLGVFARSLRAAGFGPPSREALWRGHAEAIAKAGEPRRSPNEQLERSRAEYTFTQFHNQTPTSSLHRRLVEMWAAIRTESRGRVDTRVLAQNNGIAGSDPAASRCWSPARFNSSR